MAELLATGWEMGVDTKLQFYFSLSRLRSDERLRVKDSAGLFSRSFQPGANRLDPRPSGERILPVFAYRPKLAYPVTDLNRFLTTISGAFNLHNSSYKKLAREAQRETERERRLLPDMINFAFVSASLCLCGQSSSFNAKAQRPG
jgi:hypothetical protein